MSSEGGERMTTREVLDLIAQYIEDGDGWMIKVGRSILFRVSFEQKGADSWVEHEIWDHRR